MRFDNPTQVRIGMSGTFVGIHYRVAGRVVMGMEEGGEVYSWQEFNLISDQGSPATLVFEETEEGPQWRLFTLFEPRHPMSAQEAATKRVGQSVDLDGTMIPVTLVDESRVYFIEGEAPEGVEVGDVAQYFNAESGSKMLVASWTGDEIEFYRGMDLPPEAVSNAFGIRAEVPESFSKLQGDDESKSAGCAGAFVKVIVVLAVAAVVFSILASFKGSLISTAAKPAPLPPSPLLVGAEGDLDGRHYKVEWHGVVQIAEVGRNYQRHEYELSASGNNEALLVRGLTPDAKDWFLFVPCDSQMTTTPLEGAAVRIGDKTVIDGVMATVTGLSRATIVQSEGADIGLTNRAMLFSFTAEAKQDVFIARWNQAGIAFLHGKMLHQDVPSAFNPKPK